MVAIMIVENVECVFIIFFSLSFSNPSLRVHNAFAFCSVGTWPHAFVQLLSSDAPIMGDLCGSRS